MQLENEIEPEDLELSDPDALESGRRNRGLLLFAPVCFALVIASLLIPVPFVGRVAVAIGDLVHAPLFALLTWGLLTVIERIRPLQSRLSLLVRSVVVLLALFAFGVLVEVMQAYSGRNFAIHDAVANGLGIVAALCVYWYSRLARLGHNEFFFRGMFVAIATAAMVVAWWSPIAILYDVVEKHRRFPLLASFESDTELQRFYFRDCEWRRTHQDATDGSHSMQVTFHPTDYPAATMIELIPDWSGMQTLELDITADDSQWDPRALVLLKVIDVHRQRGSTDMYRHRWQMRPGQRKHIRITREELADGPDTRQLDLSQIRYVELTVLDADREMTMRVDAIRLTL